MRPAAAGIVFRKERTMTTLATTFGHIPAIFRTIDLLKLIGGRNGDASLSRFRLAVFTFVIAVSFFVVVATDPSELPAVRSGVFALLGISGGSYVVSRGIRARMERDSAEAAGGAAASG